jgi:hypothetical protein
MTIDLNRFRYLHPEGQNLIRRWFDKGWTQRDCQDQDGFEPFIFTYIAFNGWAACITRLDQDRSMIDALKDDVGLASDFQRRLGESPELHDAAEAFRSLWPIFSAKGLRARRIPLFRSSDRSAIITHYLNHGANQFKPTEADPQLNLANTLDTLYQVRNNLFHGEKCVSSEADQRIVGAAFRILVHWFRWCLYA